MNGRVPGLASAVRQQSCQRGFGEVVRTGRIGVVDLECRVRDPESRPAGR